MDEDWELAGNIDTLRRETRELANLFERRIDQLRNRPDLVRTMKTLSGANFGDIESLLSPVHVAVGIDGSMDYDEVLEMLLFHVAAAGYQCEFTIHKGIPEFNVTEAERTSQLTLSTVVPLWREDLLNVAQTTLPLETELDFRSNLERIPFALMTMSELYLALNIIRDGSVGIVFLDRPFSATYPSLYRELGVMMQRKNAPLEGFETAHGPLTRLDILLASIIGPGSFYVPRRGGFLRYAGIQLLLKGEMRKEELARELKLGETEACTLFEDLRRLNKRKGVEGALLSRDDPETIALRSEVHMFWQRIEEVTLKLVEGIFNPTEASHSLILPNGSWLTVIDLNSLNVFLLQMMMHEALKRNVLVIGVAKDTTSTDFTRSALPLALRHGKERSELPGLKNDKALLTILSTVNSKILATPWRTFSYDAAHTTLVMGERGNPVAARKIISRELFFVRQYFQLRTFASDPEIRGPVFLFDRPYNPNYDEPHVSTVEGYEKGKLAKLHLFMELETKRSLLDDLCLLILSKCDNPEVLEAYGHNQLLYLADKFVKREVLMNKAVLRGVVELELTPLARKQKVFSIARRFRDLRAESESARKASADRREDSR